MMAGIFGLGNSILYGGNNVQGYVAPYYYPPNLPGEGVGVGGASTTPLTPQDQAMASYLSRVYGYSPGGPLTAQQLAAGESRPLGIQDFGLDFLNLHPLKGANLGQSTMFGGGVSGTFTPGSGIGLGGGGYYSGGGYPSGGGGTAYPQFPQAPSEWPGWETMWGGAQQAQNIINMLSQPWDPSQIESTFAQSVATPAREQWRSEIIPDIMERFAGSESLSSSGLNRALTRSGERLETGLAASKASMLQADRDSYYNRLAQAISPAAGMWSTAGNLALGRTEAQLSAAIQQANLGLQSQRLAADLSQAQQAYALDQARLGIEQQRLGIAQHGSTLADIQTLYPLAQQERAIQQELLNEARSNWLYNQPYNNPYLQYVPSSLGVPGFENLVQPGQSAGSIIGGIGSGMQTGMSLYNALAGNSINPAYAVPKNTSPMMYSEFSWI